MHSQWATMLAAAAQQIKVEVPDGEPLWATAVVAVGAALLGSAVGGYATFRGSEALELRRRRARAQIRRKAKIYTPIRTELLALREACRAGKHLSHGLIVRERQQPSLANRRASLHLWKDLVEDGRAMTTTSAKVRALLDHVEECADALNREVVQARVLFDARAREILEALRWAPAMVHWVEADAGHLLRGEFDDLHVLGQRFGSGPPPELVEGFVERWRADAAVTKTTVDVLRVDEALRDALDAAITELDAAMKRIADKYENESPSD